MNLTLRNREGTLFVALLSLAVIAAMYASLKFSLEPFWLLTALAAIAPAFFLMRKVPVIVLTALLFVGSFKTVAAQGISFTDPTMILLLLSAGAIFIELLSTFSGDSEWSLQDKFRGQTFGIVCFLIFVAVIALSYLYTVSPNYGWVKLSRFLVFKPLVFFAPLVLFKRERHVRQFVMTFFILGLVLTVKDVYGFLHPTQELLSGDADTTRIGDAQLIGMTLLILFFSSHFRRFPKILGLAVVLFLGLGLVAVTARGPLLSVLFVLITYSFIARTIKTSFSYKQLLVGLLVLASLILPALSWVERYPAVQARVSEKEKELAAFLQGERDPGGTLGERLEYYNSAAAAFAEKPLSGWGIGGWPVYFFGIEKEDYPHNLFLEIAAEQGLPGLIALSAFFISICAAGRQIWKQRPDLAFPIPLFGYSLLTCMFSGDLNTRSLWLLCGTILAISRMCASEANARFQYRYPSPVFLLPERAAEYSEAA